MMHTLSDSVNTTEIPEACRYSITMIPSNRWWRRIGSHTPARPYLPALPHSPRPLSLKGWLPGWELGSLKASIHPRLDGAYAGASLFAPREFMQGKGRPYFNARGDAGTCTKEVVRALIMHVHNHEACSHAGTRHNMRAICVSVYQ